MSILKKKNFSILLFFAMLCCIGTPAIAQRGRYRLPPPKEAKPTLPGTKQKNEYRIDLLLPLSLSQNTATAEALAAKQLYEGIVLAIDTLEQRDYTHFNIIVHDTKDNPDLIKANASSLQGSDLIIGAVQSAEVAEIANIAKAQNINFFSILSPSDGDVMDNPYLTLFQPTLSTHLKYVMNYGSKKFDKLPTFLLYRSDPREQEMFVQMKQSLRGPYTEIYCPKTWQNNEVLKNKFSKTETNLVYMCFINPNYAIQALQQLQSLGAGYKFEIIGMPSWKGSKGIMSAGAFPNMNIYISSPFNYDDNDAARLMLRSSYKKLNGGSPTEYVYRGYETIVFATELLKRYGTIFNEQISNMQGTMTDYNVQFTYTPEGQLKYMENQNLYMYRYNGGKLLIEQ